MSSLEYHPLANIFPLIEAKDFDDFCAGLKADGRLHDKIVMFEGKILDGRNRHRACEATGVTAHYRTFDPDVEGDPRAFVWAKNANRRHLTLNQRVMAMADLGKLGWGGYRLKSSIDDLTIDRRAEMAGVGSATIERADTVKEQGAPELVDAVKRGQVSVSAAADIVKALPIDEQRALVMEVAKSDDTRKAFAGAVKELRREKQDKKRDRRDSRERELGQRIAALPDAKFGVILADPEWPFEVWSEGTGQDRAAKNHYPTSTVDVIASRPVAGIAADDCVLGLWATVPKLLDALEVMRAWGFIYVTHVAWVKDRIGTGYWFRNRHELLLIGKRGSPPKPADGTQWESVVLAEVRGHSVKPDWQYDLFEAYFPTLPKIELNARRRRLGWTPWGFDAPEGEDGSLNAPHHGEVLPPGRAQGEPPSPTSDSLESTDSVAVAPNAKADAAEAAPHLSPAPSGEGAASKHECEDIPDILRRTETTS